jgi:hypothetical protein
LIQFLINRQRQDEGLRLAEEKPLPDEEKFGQGKVLDAKAGY